MSYEGYYVHLCSQGHRWTVSAGSPEERLETDICPTCQSSLVFCASVDETNGVFDDDPFTQAPNLIETGFTESECKDHRGNVYFVKHPTYTPPPEEIGTRWTIINNTPDVPNPVEEPAPLYPLNEVETLGYRAFLRAWKSCEKNGNHWFKVSEELQKFLHQEGGRITLLSMENFFRGMRYGFCELNFVPMTFVGAKSKLILEVKNPVLYSDVLLSYFSDDQYLRDLGALVIEWKEQPEEPIS